MARNGPPLASVFGLVPFTPFARPRSVAAALVLGAFAVAALPIAAPAASPARTIKKTAKTAPSKRPVKRPAGPGYHPHPGLAPADEYFGKLGMSILGVRSKVKDLGLDYEVHPEHEKAILGTALWVEDAMRDWAKKYPFDRWLPRYAYALEVMYEQMPGDDAHRRAVKQIAYLTAYFPQTLYGRIGRAKLAQGVPMPDPSDPPAPLSELQRLALLDGKVAPTMPPAPTPKPSPSPSPEPSASPAPPEPTASAPPAMPSPAPAASARPQRTH
ncbi:MAG TPA: hypothetical protein VHT53_04765 [Candidatus Elarobacter sp.]|jgi:hypothetical protein|nr:hypothetical protein [Candidatus Elarobacter sp.]